MILSDYAFETLWHQQEEQMVRDVERRRAQLERLAATTRPRRRHAIAKWLTALRGVRRPTPERRHA